MTAQKNIIRLTESDIRRMVENACYQALKEGRINESDIEEGVKDWIKDKRDRVKAGLEGFKQGTEAHKSLNASTDNLKYEHDYEDFKQDSNPFGPRSKRTAQEQANYLFDQAKYYRDMANSLYAKAQSISAKYSLKKTVNGRRENTVQIPQAAHNTTIRNIRSTTNGYGNGRNPNNITPIKSTGLFGA